MKYYRKDPVEAIQWRGDNQKEVSEFVERVSRGFCTQDNEDGKLTVGYLDSKQNSHIVKMPKFGWVVAEGNTLQFYKDETFKKTFESVVDRLTDYLAGRTNGIIIDKDERALEGFNDPFRGFHGISKEKIQDYVNKKASKDEEVRKDDGIKCSEESIKKLNENFENILKETRNYGFLYSLSQEDVHAVTGESLCKSSDKVTFDSVLDELKELHAKKNKDYGDAFHKSFIELGPMAGIVRLNDKMERAKSLVKNGKTEVKDESLLDTLKDMSCYAVLLYVELKNKENE